MENASEIPVFESGLVKYTALELVKILLDENQNKNYVCKKQPLRITQSKVFLIDTSNLDDPDDLKADDLGSWRNDGQHSQWVKVTKKGCSVKKVELCSGKPQGDPKGYCLHRHYFVHHSTSQFKRKIIYLTGMFESVIIIIMVYFCRYQR